MTQKITKDEMVKEVRKILEEGLTKVPSEPKNVLSAYLAEEYVNYKMSLLSWESEVNVRFSNFIDEFERMTPNLEKPAQEQCLLTMLVTFRELLVLEGLKHCLGGAAAMSEVTKISPKVHIIRSLQRLTAHPDAKPNIGGMPVEEMLEELKVEELIEEILEGVYKTLNKNVS